MEYADHIKFYQKLKDEGKRSPLDTLPNLSSTSSWYIEAFRIFNSGRQELNQIPLNDIFSYIEHFDIIGSKEEFIYVIQKLDSTFLDYYNKKRESKHGRHDHSKSKTRR